MKLLGWMHRKFRQNSGEPLKDFVIGHPSSDEQQYFPRTSINKPFKQAQITSLKLTKKSLSETGVDEDYDELVDESQVSNNISEIFPGFLAIGTLGSSDPATPKFSISIEYITERDQTDQVTQNDLKLINDELEKVLDQEAKDDRPGSRRNSNGKVLEGADHQNYNGGDHVVVCPLQGYLFGSAVEFSETTAAVAKKENRTSLGELFLKSKVSEELVGGGKCEKELGVHDKYGIQLIKKKLKKRMIGAASKSSTNSSAGGVLDVSTDQTKLHKILHLFNRSKVYPESSPMMKEKLNQKAQRNDKKKKTNIDGGAYKNNNGDHGTSTDEDIKIFPKKLIFKKNSLPHYKSKCVSKQFSNDDDDVDSIWNEEKWIKTDADYLVLEL